MTAMNTPGPRRPSLLAVRAAQLRTKARRRAIGQLLFATIFLVGALSYALAPGRHEQMSLLWMTGLLLLSTLEVAWGLSTLARLQRRARRAWLLPTTAWGLLAVLVLGYLLRR
jgi:heme/copper-type cytochrome/quinol oxidase subunit 3